MPAPRPNGRKSGTTGRRVPIQTVDFDAVLAQALAYVDDGGLAKTSQRTVKDVWARWETLCGKEDWEPFDAPFEAFKSLWLLRREDGRPMLRNSILSTVWAVSRKYEDAGLTPAYKDPGNIGEWKRLSAGHARTSDQVDSQVVPMMRADALALVGGQLPWPLQARRLATRVLLLLDGVRPMILDRLTADGVAFNVDGSVTVGEITVACDHAERARGVPWDCSACALRDLVARTDGGRRLFHPGDAEFDTASQLSMWRKWFPGLAPSGQPAGPRAGMTDWQLAGLRRAMVLYAHQTIDGEPFKGRSPQVGLRWARARAWAAVGWTCGLRMGADTDRLNRSRVRPDPSERGWSVSLGQTKDDPWGSKTTVRAFAWPDAGGPSAAQVLAEYACVRDALAGLDDLPFFSRLRPGKSGRASVSGSSADPGISAQLACHDLDLLAALAGAEPVFTSYSTRKGYVAQADADGRPVEDIQEGLRHVKLDTTLRHYAPGKDGKAVAAKAIGVFTAGSGAGQSGDLGAGAA